MRLNRFSLITTVLICLTALSSVSLAQINLVPTVDSRADANTNSFASGSYFGLNPNSGQNSLLGSWELTSSVAGTDFDNDGLVVGRDGVQYTSINNTLASDDVNEIRFSTDLQGQSSISISQSPYNNADTLWNGGQAEAARLRVLWSGGGTARVIDPDNQIVGFDTNSRISSGTFLPLNGRVYNDEDSWRIDLPLGVDTVQVNWSSQAPVSNSDLTREWVTFNVTSTVPEPSGLGMLLSALFGLGFIRRR